MRRKYGAILFNKDISVLAHNKRVSRCCNGVCIRDVMNVKHGHNTDVGAEIHAEQALLINSGYVEGFSFLIAGYGKDGKPLYGLENWPCYSCARMLKEANISSVWSPLINDEFTSYLIDGILEQYEQEILESFQ